jgi:hypothetical protein
MLSETERENRRERDEKAWADDCRKRAATVRGLAELLESDRALAAQGSRVFRGATTARPVAVHLVFADGEPMRLRLELDGGSPTGLAWGYSGSGPWQLALALLVETYGAEALGFGSTMRREQDARELVSAFRTEVVAKLAHGTGWTMTPDEVREKAEALRKASRRGKASGGPAAGVPA